MLLWRCYWLLPQQLLASRPRRPLTLARASRAGPIRCAPSLAAALRQLQQGVVYVYFEVAENGATEQTQVLGTAGEVLDAEVLRVAAQLPTAVSPARLRGQPVRVYYIIPVSFKIQ